MTNLGFLAIYMLPSLVPWVRSHRSTDSIAVVNFFLGWVLTLAWAVHK